MSFKHIDLTPALRPALLPDEVLLFVQDNVGLYEGCVRLLSRSCGDTNNAPESSRSPVTRMDTPT
jgi:hypothetical protein